MLTNATKPAEEDMKAYLAKVIGHLTALPIRRQPATTSRPTTQPKPRPIVAAVYAEQAQFKALWRRVGVYYKGRFFGLAAAGGYSYRPFCATYIDPEAPERIPTELSHEFAHVWLWRHAKLPNDGNWFSEGLATAIQMEMHPDAEARRTWAARVAKGRYLPLKRLMTDTPVESRRYWQTCLLAELILADHPASGPAVIEAIRDGRSANHIVTKVLETTWLNLEQRWKARAATRPSATRTSRTP